MRNDHKGCGGQGALPPAAEGRTAPLWACMQHVTAVHCSAHPAGSNLLLPLVCQESTGFVLLCSVEDRSVPDRRPQFPPQLLFRAYFGRQACFCACSSSMRPMQACVLRCMQPCGCQTTAGARFGRELGPLRHGPDHRFLLQSHHKVPSQRCAPGCAEISCCLSA